VRVGSFHLDSLDHDLAEWLGKKYSFEAFSPEKEHLEEHLKPLIKKIQAHDLRVVIIGGTNGKGEVALILEEMALQAKMHPILWTSPHISTVRERFSFNGQMVEAKTLLDLFNKFENLCRDFSFYEFLFYCFCAHLLELLEKGLISAKPILILEVGLGGRLDATNYFDADLACLTSIGRDHMEILGSNLSGILREKIEISRKEKVLVSGVRQAFLKKEIETYCARHKIDLLQCDNTNKSNFKDQNLDLARTIWKKMFKDNFEYIKKKLWARPLMVTDNCSEFILLGTHNLDGLKQLPSLRFHEDFRSFLPADEILVALTRKNVEDVRQFIALLSTFPCLGKKIVLTSFNHERATDLLVMEKNSELLIREGKVVVCKDWKKRLSNKKVGSRVLVLGSYFSHLR